MKNITVLTLTTHKGERCGEPEYYQCDTNLRSDDISDPCEHVQLRTGNKHLWFWQRIQAGSDRGCKPDQYCGQLHGDDLHQWWRGSRQRGGNGIFKCVPDCVEHFGSGVCVADRDGQDDGNVLDGRPRNHRRDRHEQRDFILG